MTFQALLDSILTDDITLASSAYKLILSMLLGSAVGYERKRKGQMAGVRTFSLIAMGATLAMIISIYLPQEYLGLKNGDPGRIAAQVVSGIGFLGAGAIIQMKGSVRGLTTAAGIWIVAAIGLAVGAGLYIISVIATALILIVLMYIERFEHRYTFGHETRTITIETSAIVPDITPYRDILRRNGVILTTYYITLNYKNEETRISLMILVHDGTDFASLFRQLRDPYPATAITLSNQIL